MPKRAIKQTEKYTVEKIIAELQQFWSKQGCAILQPYDMPVGAGTFHPATALKALGPEPWNAVYVQPSRRPTDGRYGRHPNRLQRYYQLQVVMKPNPKNFQQLYMDSLETLGITRFDHDIRFIEDDWKSPTLGAWGLGWEVWCDGMEITQYTYFQEVGGVRCKPYMGEITYGVERLAMYLQDKDDVYDLLWNDTLTYDELHRNDEYEQSSYNYANFDTNDLLDKFDTSRKKCIYFLEETEEAKIIPAYEAVLECSHFFNLLDAHGHYTRDTRTASIKSIHGLACKVAKAYVAKFT